MSKEKSPKKEVKKLSKSKIEDNKYKLIKKLIKQERDKL